MRARMLREVMRIDEIEDPEDLARVVRLVAETGFHDMVINFDNQDGFGVDVALPRDKFAAATLGALFSITATIEGREPEEQLAEWRERNAEFRTVAERFRSPAGAA